MTNAFVAILIFIFSSVSKAQSNETNFDRKTASFPSIEQASKLNNQYFSITPRELEIEIANKIELIPELKFIKDKAKELRVRVFLFGGTASGLVHYVKWNLQQKKGDPRYQGDRFDYDFTNIYRSTQDLDVVVDGSAEQISLLEAELKIVYPHFLGEKSAKWELRSLRESKGTAGQLGYKEALLNDYDFLNQNSDSNSTGMVEVTDSQEPKIRDLRDWNSEYCRFLIDSAAGKITFYKSKSHSTTARFKAGENPEIFSVVRALTKAFQYDLEFDQDSLTEIKSIIHNFDPAVILQSSNAKRRLVDIGKKLYIHAVNIEYASKVITDLGLKEKLLVFDRQDERDSLAYWMSKEPLKSDPVGIGEGATAKELGIDVVAHETNSFLAYESITRAHTGEPNVFISREGVPFEAAAHGDGFYTKTGRNGARKTGLTIRFQVDPKAKLHSDFDVYKINETEKYVIFKNKKALRVIQESLSMTLLEYFEFLSKGEKIDVNDKGILEKMKRRIKSNLFKELQSNQASLDQLVTNELNSFTTKKNWNFFSELVALDLDKNYPWLLEKLVNLAEQEEVLLAKNSENTKYNETADGIVKLLLSQDRFKNHIPMLKRILLLTVRPETLNILLRNATWDLPNDIYLRIIRNPKYGVRFKAGILGKKQLANDELSEAMLNVILTQKEYNDVVKNDTFERVEVDNGPLAVDWIKQHPRIAQHPEWIAKVARSLKYHNYIQRVLKLDGVANLELAKLFIDLGFFDHELATSLKESQWAKFPEIVDYIFANYKYDGSYWGIKNENLSYFLLHTLFENSEWRKNTRLLVKILEHADLSNIGFSEKFIKTVLAEPEAINHLELIEPFIKLNNSQIDELLFEHVFSKISWFSHKQVVLEVLKRKGIGIYSHARSLVGNSPWNTDVDFMNFFVSNQSKLSLWDRLEVLAKSPISNKHPNWILLILSDLEFKIPHKVYQAQAWIERLFNLIKNQPIKEREESLAVLMKTQGFNARELNFLIDLMSLNPELLSPIHLVKTIRDSGMSEMAKSQIEDHYNAMAKLKGIAPISLLSNLNGKVMCRDIFK